MTWPSQLLVEARLPSRRISDETGAIAARLSAALEHYDWSGRRVALAVGSRGIDRIAEVVRTVAECVARRKGHPFIVPAMGSHGGATPAGQAHVLAALGIGEPTAGAPIRPSMETVSVGRTAAGTDVFTSHEALNADAVILINRIKPHTDFDGAIGSGLLKMAAIGLGKREGAFECHRAAVRLGHEAVIRSVADVVLAHLPIACGVALIEDERHQLARIEVLPASRIAQEEATLFEEARRWMPSLPFAEIDVLIVDEMGKNVSGAGMDPNVIGRGVDGRARTGRRAAIGAIYARDLTPESCGNAIGLGLADVVSSRLVGAMNGECTYTNALSAMVPAMVRVPMHFQTDAECLRAAIRIAAVDDPVRVRMVRIRNTLDLSVFLASEAFAGEMASRADLNVLAGPSPMAFDVSGNFDSNLASLTELRR
jgi:Lactate racemase N-terminal domain